MNVVDGNKWLTYFSASFAAMHVNVNEIITLLGMRVYAHIGTDYTSN